MNELHAAILQGIVTAGSAAGCWYLYARYRSSHFLWWSVAWSLYVLRIAAIAAFLLTAAAPWLFVHQILTGWTALVLLWAALTWMDAARWRPLYALALVFPLGWSYVAIYQLQSFMLAAVPAVLFLSLATLWTGAVFIRQWRRTTSRGAAVLGVVLLVWGLHHLDYPVLRAMGSWNPWGYYLDILFVLAIGVGIVIRVLEELDRRTRDLERLSARIVRQHEDERHRVSLELHDQTAQVWAAVRMQLGVMQESARPADRAQLDRVLALVDTGIRSIRGVTTNLRPPLLDDLGLLPALRALVQTFAEQTGLRIAFHAPAEVSPVSPDAGLALYRALQEALSNVARHSGATAADVIVREDDGDVTLIVHDNGSGFADAGVVAAPQVSAAASVGLTGMRERITAVDGTVELASGDGATVTVRIPTCR